MIICQACKKIQILNMNMIFQSRRYFDSNYHQYIVSPFLAAASGIDGCILFSIRGGVYEIWRIAGMMGSLTPDSENH